MLSAVCQAWREEGLSAVVRALAITWPWIEILGNESPAAKAGSMEDTIGSICPTASENSGQEYTAHWDWTGKEVGPSRKR